LTKLILSINYYSKTSDYFRQNATITSFTSKENWNILSEIEQRIKAKLETAGKPLKNCDINIYRGILTGYNEAFIITGKVKDELIVKDPKSAEIIRPLLRGRDIKRYSYQFANLYIITTFPSLKIDIEQYPAIKEHLMSFGYDRLKQTGDKGARKKTSNQWFETQDSINYWEDFNRQKLIWIELVDNGRFAIDNDDHYITLNGTFIMIGNDLEFISSILNNPITSWHFNTFCISSGVGTNQWRELYVKDLFIPDFSKEQKKLLAEHVKEIVSLEKQGVNTSKKQKELNYIVYELLGLNKEEIEFIESR
jgi:adenine-specific DNA-methyltransferase